MSSVAPSMRCDRQATGARLRLDFLRDRLECARRQRSPAPVNRLEKVDQRLNGQHLRVDAIARRELARKRLRAPRRVGDVFPISRGNGANSRHQRIEDRAHRVILTHLWVVVNPSMGRDPARGDSYSAANKTRGLSANGMARS